MLNIITKICKKYIHLIEYENIIKKRKKNFFTYTDSLQKRITKLKLDIKSIDLKIEKLYMDRLDEIISSNIYKKLTDKFEQQKEKKKKEIAELKILIQDYKKDDFLESLLKTQKIIKEYFKSRKESPKELILKIVDKIEIHQDKSIDLYLKIEQLNKVV